jgi:hypothetical protein
MHARSCLVAKLTNHTSSTSVRSPTSILLGSFVTACNLQLFSSSYDPGVLTELTDLLPSRSESGLKNLADAPYQCNLNSEPLSYR